MHGENAVFVLTRPEIEKRSNWIRRSDSFGETLGRSWLLVSSPG